MTMTKPTSQVSPGLLAFSEMLTDWRERMGWTYRRMEAISALAGGSNKPKLTSALLYRAWQITEGTSSKWNPRPQLFDGIEELSRFLVGVNNGSIQPSLPFHFRKDVVTEDDLVGRVGLLDENGNLMTCEELYGIFIGMRRRPTYYVTDEETSRQFAPQFGLALEKALIESGLSPIRAADKLLEYYHGDKAKLRQVLFNEATFTPQELDAALPAIAYALSSVAGRQWSVSDLLLLASVGKDTSTI